MTEIIALSGYARSGKDEAAKVLVEEFGFTRVAFADKLREVLYALNPLVSIKKQNMQIHIKDKNGAKRLMLDELTPSMVLVNLPIYVQDVIDEFGWDGYKETEYSNEIRRLLQQLGTEAGRDILGQNIWVDAALNVDYKKIVLTDCRFYNEAQAVKDKSGQVWRIYRPGIKPINPHISETALDDWSFDKWVYNNDSLEKFKEQIRIAYSERQ